MDKDLRGKVIGSDWGQVEPETARSGREIKPKRRWNWINISATRRINIRVLVKQEKLQRVRVEREDSIEYGSMRFRG